MRRFKPDTPYTVPMRLRIPTFEMVKGFREEALTELENSPLIYGSFKTYGGTESNSNGVYTIYDTARIQTWYRPDIKQDCIIHIVETGEEYKIISAPEDINMRHQFVEFKVEKIGGKP